MNVSTLSARPDRWVLIALACLGLGLIAAPAVFKMFDRAPLGAEMIDEFAPYMKEARLDGYQRHIADIDAGVREGATTVVARLEGTGPIAQRRFERRFPEFAAFAREWRQVIHPDMSDLLSRIQANRVNYDAVAALPRFTLFPWFFVIPGVLVVLAAAAAARWPGRWRAIRWSLAGLGVGLVLAPAVFQMFDRAPKGQRMVEAFETIETRKKVEAIQGYFGSIAVGQGSVRLELIPALREQGLSARAIEQRFPGVTELDRRWVPILNDLTPMIGTMSDNVDNYQAVAALPPFSLFPWFFVAPGLMVAGLAVGRRPPRDRAAAGIKRSPQQERAA